MPCSPTPAGPIAPDHPRCIDTAPAKIKTKAPATRLLSRLNHTASALAVYASQGGSPLHHARLASGCWSSSTGRVWLPAGFLRKVSRCILHLILLSQAFVAQDFLRHQSGVQWHLLAVSRKGYTGYAWRNGVRLCSRRNLTRDIQAPLRQWRVRPLMAFVVRGRFLESHWTPDLYLRKSCGEAAFHVTTYVCAPFRRMNHC